MNNIQTIYCRFCVNPKATTKIIIDLNTDTFKRREVNEMLTQLSTFIDLSDHSPLPKTVCNHCYTSLVKASGFLQEIDEAQTVLRGIFIKQNSKVKLNPTSSELDTSSSVEVKWEASTADNAQIDNSKYIYEENPCNFNNVKDEPNENLVLESCSPIKADKTDLSECEKNFGETESCKKESWNTYEWICRHCDEELESLSELRAHSKDVHRKCYAFMCVDCTSEHDNFEAFIKHVQLHWNYLRYIKTVRFLFNINTVFAAYSFNCAGLDK